MSAISESPTICPYDLCAIDPADYVPCPGCSQRYHRECWEELGGCAVMGCPRMVEVKKPDLTASPTFWGETEKTCPYCAEKIPVAALECPLCKSSFRDMRPVEKEDILPKKIDPQVELYRRQAKWLLFFSIIGFTSPFALLFGYLWYRRNRKEIVRAGSTTYALTVASFGIATLYMIMVGVGIFVFQIQGGGSR